MPNGWCANAPRARCATSATAPTAWLPRRVARLPPNSSPTSLPTPPPARSIWAGKVAFVLAAALIAGLAGHCSAQELTGSIGVLRSDEPRERSYGWLLSYGEDLRRHFAASFSYQNEGHVPNHHRDGYAAQLWAKTSLLSPRLSLAIGAGPYRYFDTARNDDGGYSDKHGWGLVYSASATLYAERSPWLYQLRADRVLLSHGIDTTRVTAGLGYRLHRDEPAQWKSAARLSEVTFFGGRTIVNSFESQTASAYSVELRHAFGPVLRGSV